MGLKLDRLSILVAEDIAPMRRLICSVLKAMGAGQVIPANDGAQGFEIFQKNSPDIVLVDWHMEPEDGIDMVNKIRRDQLSRNRMVPIIMITGYSDVSRIYKGRDNGVTDYLVKPFSAEDLALRISYVINRPRDFIDNLPDYFGPDRRRPRNYIYNGELRRVTDFS